MEFVGTIRFLQRGLGANVHASRNRLFQPDHQVFEFGKHVIKNRALDFVGYILRMNVRLDSLAGALEAKSLHGLAGRNCLVVALHEDVGARLVIITQIGQVLICVSNL